MAQKTATMEDSIFTLVKKSNYGEEFSDTAGGRQMEYVKTTLFPADFKVGGGHAVYYGRQQTGGQGEYVPSGTGVSEPEGHALVDTAYSLKEAVARRSWGQMPVSP